MHKFLQGLFSYDLLIELRESLITVKTFSDNKVVEVIPAVATDKSTGKSIVREIGEKALSFVGPNTEVIKPFTHSRSFVADFESAEKIIQHAIRKIHDGTSFKPAPRVVMHQLEKNEGGLTGIEIRVLYELALGAGARDALVYSGSPINVETDSYEGIKSRIDT